MMRSEGDEKTSSLQHTYSPSLPRSPLQFQVERGFIHTDSGRAAIGTDIPRQFHQAVAVLAGLKIPTRKLR